MKVLSWVVTLVLLGLASVPALADVDCAAQCDVGGIAGNTCQGKSCAGSPCRTASSAAGSTSKFACYAYANKVNCDNLFGAPNGGNVKDCSAAYEGSSSAATPSPSTSSSSSSQAPSSSQSKASSSGGSFFSSTGGIVLIVCLILAALAVIVAYIVLRRRNSEYGEKYSDMGTPGALLPNDPGVRPVGYHHEMTPAPQTAASYNVAYVMPAKGSAQNPAQLQQHVASPPSAIRYPTGSTGNVMSLQDKIRELRKRASDGDEEEMEAGKYHSSNRPKDTRDRGMDRMDSEVNLDDVGTPRRRAVSQESMEL